LLGVDRVVIESFELIRDGLLVFVRRQRRDQRKLRCPICEAVCPGYDSFDKTRRWRGLDFGTTPVWIEAKVPRIKCAEHGVRVAQVPWARHTAGFTRAFEATVAWLATQNSKRAVTEFMRISWRTVGRIISRTVSDDDGLDRLAGLTRIGIDETSYRKGHRYLTVVVDHDTGHLVWAAPGHSGAVLSAFFDLLGPERCAEIKLVSADAAKWIRNTVKARCSAATLCLDPFHVVMWVTKALDEVRREVWRTARAAGQNALTKGMKGARYALWKNPGRLTAGQKATLASIAKTNKPLYRAYLLKEQFRQVFQVPAHEACVLLDKWLAWAQRCRLPAFVKVQRTIKRHRVEIDAVLKHRLSNARVESMNTKLKLITRRAFGFHGPAALIALAMLTLGARRPMLPGR
jgi:transposase